MNEEKFPLRKGTGTTKEGFREQRENDLFYSNGFTTQNVVPDP